MAGSQELLKPSVNMLPINAIKEVLNSTLIAANTLQVGTLNANQVAQNFNGEKDAVKRAYFLGERPATDYITIDDSPEKRIDDLLKAYQEETSLIRLELYRLMGLVNHRQENKLQAEQGYIEMFKTLPVEVSPATFTLKNGFIETLKPQKMNFAIPGEYIVVGWLNEKHVVRVGTIQNNVITLDSLKVAAPSIQNVTLYHYKGENKNNRSYFYSNTVDKATSEKPYNVFLGDYSQEGKGVIQRGLATSITMRSNMFSDTGEELEAILESVKAHITQKGYPDSALVCRIYRQFNENISSISLVGESEAITSPQNGWLSIPIKDMAGKPLTVSKDFTYLIAFEAATATQEDSFIIKTGKGDNNDLHTNRQVYRRFLNEYALEDTNYDLLVGLNFKAIAVNQSTPFNNGLYTSELFRLKDAGQYAYCHVRFSKEKTTYAQLDAITNTQAGFTVNAPFTLNVGETFIAGDNVLTLKERRDNIYKSNEVATIYPNDAVYPIPIQMQLLVYSDYFETSFTKAIPLKIDDVHINRITSTPELSDYLVFKCELPEAAKHAKLQIFYDDKTKAQSFVMRIEEISMSYAKGV